MELEQDRAVKLAEEKGGETKKARDRSRALDFQISKSPDFQTTLLSAQSSLC
jgi:hypothetical protein